MLPARDANLHTPWWPVLAALRASLRWMGMDDGDPTPTSRLLLSLLAGSALLLGACGGRTVSRPGAGGTAGQGGTRSATGGSGAVAGAAGRGGSGGQAGAGGIGGRAGWAGLGGQGVSATGGVGGIGGVAGGAGVRGLGGFGGQGGLGGLGGRAGWGGLGGQAGVGGGMAGVGGGAAPGGQAGGWGLAPCPARGFECKTSSVVDWSRRPICVLLGTVVPPACGSPQCQMLRNPSCKFSLCLQHCAPP